MGVTVLMSVDVWMFVPRAYTEKEGRGLGTHGMTATVHPLRASPGVSFLAVVVLVSDVSAFF